MLAQQQNYRIEPDPRDAKRWAYTITNGHMAVRTVGGFKTSADAKRAMKLAQRKTT